MIDEVSFYTSTQATAQAEPTSFYPSMTQATAQEQEATATPQEQEAQPGSVLDDDAREAASKGAGVTLAAIAAQDAALAEGLGQFLRENRLPESHVGKLAQLHQKASEKRSRDYWGGDHESWRKESLADPAIKESLPSIKKMLAVPGPPQDFKKFLLDVGLVNHPRIMRFLAYTAGKSEGLY